VGVYTRERSTDALFLSRLVQESLKEKELYCAFVILEKLSDKIPEDDKVGHGKDYMEKQLLSLHCSV
jgi:hypothetical protein